MPSMSATDASSRSSQYVRYTTSRWRGLSAPTASSTSGRSSGWYVMSADAVLSSRAFRRMVLRCIERATLATVR